jgi:hypothetical protein
VDVGTNFWTYKFLFDFDGSSPMPRSSEVNCYCSEASLYRSRY